MSNKNDSIDTKEVTEGCGSCVGCLAFIIFLPIMGYLMAGGIAAGFLLLIIAVIARWITGNSEDESQAQKSQQSSQNTISGPPPIIGDQGQNQQASDPQADAVADKVVDFIWGLGDRLRKWTRGDQA